MKEEVCGFSALQSARKAKGLSKESVARELCVTIDIVDNIEGAAFERFPRGPYFKNYVKNYCALVEMNPAPLIADYESKVCQDVCANYKVPEMYRAKLTSRFEHKHYRTRYGIACAAMIVVLVGVISGQTLMEYYQDNAQQDSREKKWTSLSSQNRTVSDLPANSDRVLMVAPLD